MIKDVMEDNPEITPTSREMAVLKEHFPGFFQNDGAFDITRFSREVLEANGTRVTQEGFGLDFLGKNYAKLIASMDTETVIVPDEAHNRLPENAASQNIYISGDNLDGVKELNVVIETKGVENKAQLRGEEQMKIDCAKKFFDQIKLEGYKVEFRTQINNRKMKQIINDVLSTDA